MPYFEEKEILILDEGKFTIHMVQWGREGQCVNMSPNCKMIVRFRDVEMTVSARSAHKTRRMALDMGELFA